MLFATEPVEVLEDDAAIGSLSRRSQIEVLAARSLGPIPTGPTPAKAGVRAVFRRRKRWYD